MHIFIGAGVMLVAAAAIAQSPFVLSSRDRAQTIAIDFVAAAQDGRPVSSLTPTEIVVKLGGRTRSVLALDYVRPPAAPGETPPPYIDNAEPTRPRSLILIVDEDTIRPGHTITVRDAIRRLTNGLSPDDRLALVAVPFGGLAVDLTTRHDRVLEAVGALTAKNLRNESTSEAQCRTLTTLGAISNTLSRLAVVEDPVTVVFFSSHQAPPAALIRTTSPLPGSPPIGDLCDLRAATFTALGDAVARARAQFYVIHTDLDQRGRGLEGLEHITGVTGAPLLHLSTASGTAAIDRVLSDTAGHFVARVRRDPADRPNEPVSVSIAVNRPGVSAWRAPTFVVAATPGVSTTPRSVTEVMRLPTVVRDLPLRMNAHTFRDDATGHVKLAVTFGSPSSEPLTVAMMGAFNPSGQLVAGLELTAEALSTQPSVAAFAVPPGSYRVRVAAADSTGRVGSAEGLVNAALTTVGGLSMGSLMVGLSRAGGFVPVMELSTEPTAFAMTEVYGAASPIKATVEIAATSNGPALMTMPGLVERTSDPTRSLVTAVLPIQTLEPGDYVVRATIAPEGQPSGRVTRVFRKVGGQAPKQPSD